LFKNQNIALLFYNLLLPGIVYSEKMSKDDDDDWFGEKLFFGEYGRTPIMLKSGKSDWNSPALLRTFLAESNDLKNTIVSTGGIFFDELSDKKIIDLSRTPENHFFVEDEDNLLLGSGLSPFTSKHLLRDQYTLLNAAFEAIEEPYNHSSSLWDLCCFHIQGALLIKAFESLGAVVSVHNGKEAINISTALLNKLTPGLPLYFLISKKA